MNRQLLDCTLRDGSYVLGKNFLDNVMRGVIHGLDECGVDYIEIGFLQDDVSNGESTVFHNAEMAKKWIPTHRNAIFTVLADYSRYSVSNLEPYDGASFDVVRACFYKHEREVVMTFGREVKGKGYRLFLQPVDALGYTHMELLQLIDNLNELQPECFSIVDTFGSMYLDDLRTLFNIVNYNLAPNIKLGFHSHNNLQMSNALSQEFINLAQNRRDTVIDATLFGMGRGAGNTPTELVAQYLNSHMGGEYDIDKILDVIDSYISSLRAYNEWGYDIPMFLSGCYSAHVNNVGYLKEKGSLRFQDLRFILSKLTRDERKRYDYSRLESLYLEYAHKKSSRKDDLQQLKLELSERDIIVIAPGKSITIEQASIKNYIQNNSPLVISANFIPQGIKPDYIYFSNQQRYDYWKLDPEYHNYRKILLSNISDESMDFVIHIKHLLKAGWSNLDNTVILLLRLLDIVNVKSIALAGVDGYEPNAENYATQDLERKIMDYKRTNDEIAQMLFDFQSSSKIPISFVTHSRFGDVIK